MRLNLSGFLAPPRVILRLVFAALAVAVAGYAVADTGQCGCGCADGDLCTCQTCPAKDDAYCHKTYDSAYAAVVKGQKVVLAVGVPNPAKNSYAWHATLPSGSHGISDGVYDCYVTYSPADNPQPAMRNRADGLVKSMPRPAASVAFGAQFGPSWVGGPTDHGETVAARCPVADIMTNIGSKIDGGGMCVDTSIETNARYLGLDGYRGYRDYFAAREPGGNYPEGVDRQLKQYAQAKGLPEPRYVQYEGPDPTAILELATKTKRGCTIAYGYSQRYGQAINHMVFCPHYGKTEAAIADNNLIGGVQADEPHRYEWMAPAELVKRMKTQADRFGRATSSGAWVFVWLEPPPPPTPFN